MFFAEDGKTMIIVEEKIDGANLGISLTDACSKLMGLRMDVVLWRYVKHIDGPCLLIKTFPGNWKPSNWSVKRAAF